MEQPRREGNLSRGNVATRGGPTVTTISAVESGNEEPTWGNLRRIAQGLGVELEELCALAVELAPGQAGGRIRRREKEARQTRDKRLREVQG